MKTYGGVHVQLHAFIASALNRTGWSARRPVGKGHQYPPNMRWSRAGKEMITRYGYADLTAKWETGEA